MYENHVGLPLSQTHARPARESEGLSPDSHEQAVAGGDPSDEDCAARAARKMIKALRSGKRNTTNAKICSTLPGALSRSLDPSHTTRAGCPPAPCGASRARRPRPPPTTSCSSTSTVLLAPPAGPCDHQRERVGCSGVEVKEPRYHASGRAIHALQSQTRRQRKRCACERCQHTSHMERFVMQTATEKVEQLCYWYRSSASAWSRM